MDNTLVIIASAVFVGLVAIAAVVMLACSYFDGKKIKAAKDMDAELGGTPQESAVELPTLPCPQCDGEGHKEDSEASSFGEIMETVFCSACDGTGKVDSTSVFFTIASRKDSPADVAAGYKRISRDCVRIIRPDEKAPEISWSFKKLTLMGWTYAGLVPQGAGFYDDTFTHPRYGKLLFEVDMFTQVGMDGTDIANNPEDLSRMVEAAPYREYDTWALLCDGTSEGRVISDDHLSELELVLDHIECNYTRFYSDEAIASGDKLIGADPTKFASLDEKLKFQNTHVEEFKAKAARA